jgi:hypothetical protein
MPTLTALYMAREARLFQIRTSEAWSVRSITTRVGGGAGASTSMTCGARMTRSFWELRGLTRRGGNGAGCGRERSAGTELPVAVADDDSTLGVAVGW